MKTLIKNGKIITESEIITGDILVEDEKIIDISSYIPTQADIVIDADGKYILPGGVDQHVHFGYTYQGNKVRGFETSAAAILGGTTTIADFVDAEQGETRLEALERYEKYEIAGSAHCDYVLHINLKVPTAADYKEMMLFPDYGVSTVNLFMSNVILDTYARDNEILKILDAAKAAGITTFVHAENCDIADFLVEKLLKEGKNAPLYHKEARPIIIEEESITRICCFSLITQAKVMVTHISCKEGVDILRSYQKRGAPIYGETCPQYLVLDEDMLGLPGFAGANYVCNPPLRPKEHNDYLWQALKDGSLICVGTDHCAFDSNQKRKGLAGHHLIPKGIPSLQDRLGVLWTYGVAEDRISINEMVNVFAKNPAKSLGIYPQKGVLKPGSDADIVIFDPEQEGMFTNQESLHGIDYNAYEGMKKTGAVDLVLLRGNIVYKRGSFLTERKHGRRIRSKPAFVK